VIDPIRDPNLSGTRRWKHVAFLSARAMLLPILRLLLRMRIHGLKNVPRHGGAVVICNHLGWFDPVLLLAASPRPIMFMAKAEFLNLPVLRWFALQAGAFPVKRGRPDLNALRHAQHLLGDGMLVGMFPEGTRSKTGALQQPFAGASMVAMRSRAPLIPCILIGTEDLPLSGSRHVDRKRRRYPKVTAVFGDPFVLQSHRPDGTKYTLDELTDAMMIEVARMLPERYRGVYAARCAESHPAVCRECVAFTGPAAAV
jgi:1-acyl-sn-glycerol-3-phosphate acyltransferase